jgi:hypothetical protein
MNKNEKIFLQLSQELARERQLADQLADALIHGGLARCFEALTMHEVTRNGLHYQGVVLGKPVVKRAKRGPRNGHPTAWFQMPPQGFHYEPKKPTEEETEE